MNSKSSNSQERINGLRDKKWQTSAKGTPAQPIVIRATEGQTPLLTRPADNINRHNNIEFVDCSHLTIRGKRFQGGSSGVRSIRGHHVTFEKCEIFETGKNDYWPRAGSSLINHAHSVFAPKLDFNCISRKAPFDVGAYESDGRTENPGWKIQTGFKSCLRRTDLRKVADFDDDPVRQVSVTR